MERCHLCGKVRQLRESHIIPSWYYRDEIRDQAHGGRFHDVSSMRTHGKAVTLPLMCGECEQLVGVFDNDAKKFNQSPTKEYGPWLLRFAASISWRVLKYWCLEPEYNRRHPEFASDPNVAEALTCWGELILKNKIHPRLSRHTQHLFNVANSYEMRQVILTTVQTIEGRNRTQVVLSRFGSFAILGIIHADHPKGWQVSGSRIYGVRGQVPDRQYGTEDTARFLDKIEQRCREMVTDFNRAKDDGEAQRESSGQ